MTKRPPSDGNAGPDEPPVAAESGGEPASGEADQELVDAAPSTTDRDGADDPWADDASADARSADDEEPSIDGAPEEDEPGDEESDEDTQELEIPEAPLTGGVRAPLPAPEHKSVWPIWAWMMVGVALLVLGVGVVGGVLVPSIVLDVVSFWPGFLVTFLLAAAIWPLSRRFSSRLKATVPLLVITWLGLAVALHLSGWSELPSSAGDLVGGLAEGIETGSVSIEIDGQLTLTSASQPELYAITMLRRGGPVGAPQALETTPNGSVAVDIVERPESAWYSAAGWQVWLGESLPWAVSVTTDELDADFQNVTLLGGLFRGSGVIELGDVEPGSTVTLEGDFSVSIPADASVAVVGTADLPAGWVATETGHSTPGGGEPFTLVVSGEGSVTVSER